MLSEALGRIKELDSDHNKLMVLEKQVKAVALHGTARFADRDEKKDMLSCPACPAVSCPVLPPVPACPDCVCPSIEPAPPCVALPQPQPRPSPQPQLTCPPPQAATFSWRQCLATVLTTVLVTVVAFGCCLTRAAGPFAEAVARAMPPPPRHRQHEHGGSPQKGAAIPPGVAVAVSAIQERQHEKQTSSRTYNKEGYEQL